MDRRDLQRSAVDCVPLDDVEDFINEIECKVEEISEELEQCDINDAESVCGAIQSAISMLSDLSNYLN